MHAPPLCSLLAALWLAAPLSASPGTPGNVLVLLADDLGVDRVAAYAEHHDPGRTPNIDALAANGILFRNAWANPTCSPTRALILSGRYGFRTGIGSTVNPPNPMGLDVLGPSLPRQLGSIPSAYLGKWHLGSNADGLTHPLDFGFDLAAGAFRNIHDYYAWDKVVNGVESPTTKYATTDTVDDALRVMRELPEPWFLYVAFNAPHAPFHVPPSHLHHFNLSGAPQATPVEHGKAMVEALDTEIGRLMAAVDLTTTSVIFAGDNGTSKAASEPPFVPRHAKGSLYEGGLNVPLIVAGAGLTTSGECTALVDLVDLFATVLELQGRPGGGPDSISLVPYFSRPTRPSLRAWVYAEQFYPNHGTLFAREGVALRDARYKLIADLLPGGEPEELYDLELDPFERSNLLTSTPLTTAQKASYDELWNVLRRLHP